MARVNISWTIGWNDTDRLILKYVIKKKIFCWSWQHGCKSSVAVADYRLSRIWLIANPWTVARQAPLSMGFPRQESWSGLPLPSPGDLPNPRIKPESPESQADSSPLSLLNVWFQWKDHTINFSWIMRSRGSTRPHIRHPPLLVKWWLPGPKKLTPTDCDDADKASQHQLYTGRWCFSMISWVTVEPGTSTQTLAMTPTAITQARG